MSSVSTTATNPCIPSPCGQYSECRNIHDLASCSCLPNYMGIPPFCRPECIVHSDCASNQACVAEKCQNPCEGACGIYAKCFVQNHVPVCLCSEGFTGDPFQECVPKPMEGSNVFINFSKHIILIIFFRYCKF